MFEGLNEYLNQNQWVGVLLQALCVVLLLVLVSMMSNSEGYVGKGSVMDQRSAHDPYGLSARYRAHRDDTGHGCNCGETLHQKTWGRYTDDETWRDMPVSRYWQPTHGLQEYQSDWALNARVNRPTSDPMYWDKSNTVMTEDQLAEHRHGVGH